PTPKIRQNPEPPPTCPFINQQCQRARQLKTGQPMIPDPCVPGDLVSVYVGDRPFQRRIGVVPSGEAAYMEGLPNRQTLFAVLFHNFLEGSPLEAERQPIGRKGYKRR
ncbi:hypothetical protein, partial [Sphingobium mellinum]|uniref:hypothetical protein n=1 Tax=Sphingobium mellinum TaxID=1387166 RepID=UPI0030ECC212